MNLFDILLLLSITSVLWNIIVELGEEREGMAASEGTFVSQLDYKVDFFVNFSTDFLLGVYLYFEGTASRAIAWKAT